MVLNRIICCFGVALAVWITSRNSAQAANPATIPSSSPFELQSAQAVSTKIAPVDTGLSIDFSTNGNWPGVLWKSENQWNWSDAVQLAVTVKNISGSPVTLHFLIRDIGGKELYAGFSGPSIKPGETYVLLTDLTHRTADDCKAVYGMNNPVPAVSGENVWMLDNNGGAIDLKKVSNLKIFLQEPPPDPTNLIIQSVLLYKPAPIRSFYTSIVDKFGQFTRSSWPEKITAESDFVARLDSENKDLAAHPSLPDHDEYGAWQSGPKEKATGFFHTAKLNGRWWLVAPNGNLFLSFGFNGMWPGGNPDKSTMDTPTVTSGREYMFESIPNDVHTSRSGFHYGPFTNGMVNTYDFYGANADRKYAKTYGSGDYVTGWNNQTLKRMQSWGFNTIANWSDTSANSLQSLHKLPYTVCLHSHSPKKIGRVPDPYDPEFETATDAIFKKIITPEIVSDPWCLGYYCDNEIPWTSAFAQWADYEKNIKNRYTIAISVLAATATQPAKVAFQAQLQKQYPTIEALNQAWDTTFASWEDWLNKSYKVRNSPAPTDDLIRDMSVFTTNYAAQYAQVIKKTLAKYDTNHLYFGCRFSFTSPEVIQGIARDGGADVVSFNIYSKTVSPKIWSITNTLNKACIVSEYHFGAQDRGIFGYGNGSDTRTGSQKDRAAQYVIYMKSLLAMPSFVGAHWFQYTDEPLTGRNFDGENYNIGFIDVADTPYKEMVEAARNIHNDAYTLHQSCTPLP
jgi:hypothetical protein